MKKISELALMTFKGMNSNTVEKIFPEIIVEAEDLKKKNKNCYYVGTKNTNVISIEFINKLNKLGFLHHTIDSMAKDGRAIDINLKNPITGRFMTGSSSGTAINVFLGINDIGIGTDGGGSVLAPALSLNLYGFISNLFDREYIKKFNKKSTDEIEFSPSIGLISKDITKIEYLINSLILGKIEKSNKDILPIKIAKPKFKQQLEIYNKVKNDIQIFSTEDIKLEYYSSDRRKMMQELLDFDFENNILITFEGPIDLYEYGDSIMGHYSEFTKSNQDLSHKYYLKIVNMMNLSAFCIPSSDLSVGTLIICKSDKENISKALDIAKKIKFKRSILEESYFN